MKMQITALFWFSFVFFSLLGGCTGSDTPDLGGRPPSFLPENPNADYIQPTAQEYTEFMDDPNGRVIFNGFSANGFEVDANLNEIDFSVSWDISYNNDYFFYYTMTLYILDKGTTTEDEWDDNGYIGRGFRLDSKALNNNHNFGTFYYTYNFIENAILVEDESGERYRFLGTYGDDPHLLCVAATQIYHSDFSFSSYRAHRILKLNLKNNG